jgi:hypothetical protein
MSKHVHWADVVDDDEEEDPKLKHLVDSLRRQLRATSLLKSHALTTGMPVLDVKDTDSATCQRALKAVENDVPPELALSYDDQNASFYVNLSPNFYLS